MSRTMLVLFLGAAVATPFMCGGCGYGEGFYEDDHPDIVYVNEDAYPVYYTDECYEGQGGLYYAPHYEPDEYETFRNELYDYGSRSGGWSP